MITSGWIFPDETEISTIAHEEVAKAFIQGIFNDSLRYANIAKIANNYLKDATYPDSMLCDFAVQVLGWIKVGSLQERIVTYGGYNFQDELIFPYLLSNYYDDNRHYAESFDYFIRSAHRFIRFECDWLKIIEQGAKMPSAYEARKQEWK